MWNGWNGEYFVGSEMGYFIVNGGILVVVILF